MSKHPYPLFFGYGIELEYMIVDKDTLHVKHLADDLLKHELGEIGSDFENGMVTWSNELVLHVIEIKATKPENDLETLEKAFQRNILRINTILEKWNAVLMPSAAHPFMDPFTETKLWPHDNNEVYALFNNIFNCRGHGWANLQSTHLNLPFSGDKEFAQLHAAIRLILPLLPALCASSPILNGEPTGILDTRLIYYKKNQARIPSISGSIIPEAVFSNHDYQSRIYSVIEKDIAEYNHDNILDPVWVNSRGAIARFDRGSIEIRIMDIQECAVADVSIVNMVIHVLKILVSEKLCTLQTQMNVETDQLTKLFDRIIETGRQTIIDDSAYLAIFGLSAPISVKDLWKYLLSLIQAAGDYDNRWQTTIQTILENGCLSERILSAISNNPSPEHIKEVYRELSKCLAENRIFIP